MKNRLKIPLGSLCLEQTDTSRGNPVLLVKLDCFAVKSEINVHVYTETIINYFAPQLIFNYFFHLYLENHLTEKDELVILKQTSTRINENHKGDAVHQNVNSLCNVFRGWCHSDCILKHDAEGFQ